jgi:superoxide dismutase
MKRRSIIPLTLLTLSLLSTPMLSAQEGGKVSREAGLQPRTAALQQGMADGAVHQLIALPYATNALEPVISERTVKLHHGKHLAGYVSKLNQLLAENKIMERDLVKLVKFASGSVFDNAGQLLNHNLYFTQFKPANMKQIEEPKGALAEAIKRSFGSFEKFRERFEKAGASIFGSGWLWLAANEHGSLYIDKEPNGGNPVTIGLIPILGIDVWEHAYYLDYENRRAEHLKQIWHIIDWEVVSRRYEERTSFFSK